MLTSLDVMTGKIHMTLVGVTESVGHRHKKGRKDGVLIRVQCFQFTGNEDTLSLWASYSFTILDTAYEKVSLSWPAVSCDDIVGG